MFCRDGSSKADMKRLQKRVELRGLREDVRRDTETIGVAHDANSARSALLGNTLEEGSCFVVSGLERHHSAIKAVRAGVHDANLRITSDPLADLRSEFVDAAANNIGTELLVEIERSF